MSQPARTERSAYLDNAKAILIVLVVFTHLFSINVAGVQPGKAVYQLILLFHMPAFIFVTGMLAKSDAYTEKGARSLRRLAWAYVLFQLINYAWGYVFFGSEFSLNKVLFSPVFALWFLLALFWWRLMLPLFARGTSRRAALLSVAVAVVVSVVSGYFIRHGGWIAIARTLTFLPFYVAGYRVAEQKWSLPRSPWIVAAALISFVGVWAALYGGRGYVRAAMLYGNASYHQMGLRRFEGGLVRIAVLALGMLLVLAFLQLVPRGRSWISALGATTLSVYVWHALAVRNIKFYDLGQLFAGSLVAVILTTVVMVAVFGWGPIPSATAWLTGARWPKERRSHDG